MRAVIQRVKSSRVEVEDQIVGQINRGYTVLLGVEEDDTEVDLNYLVDKIPNLRIFEDEEGKMNKSILDVGGSLLVISQFTLMGDARKGRRPSFSSAARPDKAIPLYESFIQQMRDKNIHVECGVFQADMTVHIANDGPVTLLLDSKKGF